jgi:hypothetical protein
MDSIVLGQTVHYHPYGAPGVVLVAIVAAINPDSSVNLAIISDRGVAFDRQDVPVVYGAAVPDSTHYCTTGTTSPVLYSTDDVFITA